MVRKVGLAGAAFLFLYAVASVATGQQLIALGDFAQLIPPLAYAGFTIWLARQSRGQVRVFWNLNAIHGVTWAIGQAVWTYYDLFRGGVPAISPTDPLFFVSSIPLAAALYGRPERDRPRWLFDIVAARPDVDRAVLGVRLHLLRRVDRGDRWPRGSVQRQPHAAAERAQSAARALGDVCVAHLELDAVAADAWRVRDRPGADVPWRPGLRRRRDEGRLCAGWVVGYRLHGAVRGDAAGRGDRLRREALRARGRSAGAVEAAGRIADRHRAAGGDPGDRSRSRGGSSRCRRPPSRCASGSRSR